MSDVTLATLPAPTDRYAARFERVLAHIDAHLDDDLSIDRLCQVAALSKFHFHRQFAARFGVGVGRYVMLRRLQRAAHRLATRPADRVIDIALDSGYDSAEAFTRAFRQHTGVTPSHFRRAPQAIDWPAFSMLLAFHNHPPRPAMHPVRIVDFPVTRVAVLTHRGDPRTVGATVQRFIAWRREHRLPPATHATFNVFHDNPHEVDPATYRMDLCVALDTDVPPNPLGITSQHLPSGRCAVLRHTGPDTALEAAIVHLYRDWLPTSGETPRDAPLFAQRVSFPPEVAADEAVVDLYLPLM